MYKCEICEAVTPSGSPRTALPLRRPNGQTEREVAVCRECEMEFLSGTSLSDMLARSAPPLDPDLRRLLPPASAPVPVPTTLMGRPVSVVSAKRERKAGPAPLTCDLCGGNPHNGQITSQSTICDVCLRRTRQR